MVTVGQRECLTSIIFENKLINYGMCHENAMKWKVTVKLR